jgi:hypothetical protein
MSRQPFCAANTEVRASDMPRALANRKNDADRSAG